MRFAVAAAVLLGVARFRVRAACRPAVLATGALGYGGTVLVQNLAITRTSVSHAALLIGAAPVMVAIIAAVWHRSVARPAAWRPVAVSLAGVALVAGGGGGGATMGGDGLVLLSVLLSAGFTVSQGRLLRGQDPVAVTAVQFAAAALVALPVALVSGRIPAATGSGPMLAVAVLALGGTVLPFTLFAFGSVRCALRWPGRSSTWRYSPMPTPESAAGGVYCERGVMRLSRNWDAKMRGLERIPPEGFGGGGALEVSSGRKVPRLALSRFAPARGARDDGF